MVSGYAKQFLTYGVRGITTKTVLFYDIFCLSTPKV